MSEQVPEPGSRLPDIDTVGIMALIPHRYPMLLIDRVIEIEVGKRAVGIKNVTMNEPFFVGHFPHDPIMPGVFIIEAMAQSAAVLVVVGLGPGHGGNSVYFMSVDNARFRRPVRPGDQLQLEVIVQRSRLGVWKFTGRGTVGGELAAEAEFSAKIITR